MKKYGWMVLMGLLLVNCSGGGDFFSEKTIVIKDFKCQKELKPELFLEEYGISKLICLKNYLLCTMVEGREKLFYVYNYDGDSLGCFGNRGQGPNELLNCTYRGQFYENNKGSLVWINDVMNKRMCAININKSLETGNCYFEKIQKTATLAVNSFYCNDSLIIAEEGIKDNYNLLRIDPRTETIIDKKPIYRIPVTNPFSHYKSTWRLKPNGEKIVSVMQSINQINIEDLNTSKRISLRLFSKYPKLENVVDMESGIERQTYYCDVEVTDEYIYALYMNQPQIDAFAKEKPQEIHVFTWSGEAVCQFIIPQYITKISLDEKGNCFFGLDLLNEKIYKYKFSLLTD